MLEHVPLCKHGEDEHQSIKVSHCMPEYPVGAYTAIRHSFSVTTSAINAGFDCDSNRTAHMSFLPILEDTRT